MDPSPQVLGIEVLLRFRDSNTRTQGEDYGVEPIVARPKGDSETVRTYSTGIQYRSRCLRYIRSTSTRGAQLKVKRRQEYEERAPTEAQTKDGLQHRGGHYAT